MKKIATVLLMLCFVQALCGAGPEIEPILGRYFSNVTASPGRITLTVKVLRIHFDLKFDEEGNNSFKLLEKGETISLAPGFAEASFWGRHSWISIKRVGSGNIYEVISASDLRSFGKELEERKFTMLFSQTELVFKEGSPNVDKAVGNITANKKPDSPLKSVQSPSGGIKGSRPEVLSGNPSMLIREQEFPWLWIVIAVLIAAGGLLWWLLKRRK